MGVVGTIIFTVVKLNSLDTGCYLDGLVTDKIDFINPEQYVINLTT